MATDFRSAVSLRGHFSWTVALPLRRLASATLKIARGDLGSLEIRSKPGRGTQIVVRIPLEKQGAVA